jgi:rhodanese-related sulfurtransferase
VIPAFPHVTREDVRRKVEAGDVVLVDARSPMAFALSHLPGAVNLTSRWVAERASWYISNPETETIVYCGGVDCDNASTVAAQLVQLGYRNVHHYAEGIEDWAGSGLPLEGRGVRT